MKLSHKGRNRHARRVAARNGGIVALQPPFVVGQEVKIVAGAPDRYIGTTAKVLSIDLGNRTLTVAAYRRKSPLPLGFADAA